MYYSKSEKSAKVSSIILPNFSLCIYKLHKCQIILYPGLLPFYSLFPAKLQSFFGKTFVHSSVIDV